MTLAYLDVISGLVPCRVINWTPYQHEYAKGQFGAGFNVEYTATRGAYLRGEKAWWPVYAILPRVAVYIRNRKYQVAPYSWPDLAPELFGVNP